MKNKAILSWLFIGIPLISVLIFRRSFNLGLYGDDWIQLYNIWLSFDVYKQLSYFDIRSYIGAYWPQYLFLGIIKYFFGYQAQAYFVASLFLRILATISLFFLGFRLSRSLFMAFIASLAFTFIAAGLQTTDWVFNMNTYAGMFFFNLSMIFYLNIRKLKTIFSFQYAAFILSFTLALASVPVRMHGAVPLIIATELFLFFLERKIILKANYMPKADRFLIFRLILPIIILLLLIKSGSFGNSGDNTPLFKASFAYLQDMLYKGRYDILFYYLGIIGNITLPDISGLSLSFNRLLPITLLFTSIGFLFSYAIKANKFMYGAVIIFNILWAFVIKILLLWNPGLSFSNIFSISLGYQTIVLPILIFHQIYKKYPIIASSIIISLLWLFLFTIIYWPRTGFAILETTSRYLTVGAMGFSLLFAAIIAIMLKNFSETTIQSAKIRLSKSVILLISFITVTYLLTTNYKAGQLYLTSLETNRSLGLVNKTWDSLKREVPKLDENEPSVFYFTSDNPTALYMVLTFGFWPHAGLIYNITDMLNTPLPTDNYSELVEMVRTGEPLKRVHARKESPVPLSRVFAFDFRNEELINITESTRKKISVDLNIKP